MSLGPSEDNVENGPTVVQPGFHRVKKQFLMVLVGNILVFSQGTNIGWYSPALPVLQSAQPGNPLHDGPIDQETAGWIGSFLAIGAIFGALAFGFVANWIGYKRSLQLTTFPMICSWLFIIFGEYSWQISASRFCCGAVGGSAFACLPQFTAEIASDHVRGQLNSYIQMACYGGILVGFICGSYLPYAINPIAMVSIAIVYFIWFYFMPESPQFLIRKNRIEEAEKSLRFYRNVKTTDDRLENQLITEEFEKFKAIAKQNAEQPPLTVSDFVNPIALRAMLISPFLMAVNQFSGAFAITNYAETIFKGTGSSFDPQISSIVMAATQVVGTYVASQLMDKCGRKKLLLVSLIGGIVAHLITGTYAYLAQNEYDVSAFNWVPIVSISSFIFLCSIGMLPAPYVMLAEVIPQRIRRIATTLMTSIVFICQTIVLRLMPVLLNTLNLYGTMWMFALIAMLGLVFTIFVVKETKGKNLDVLEVKNNIADGSNIRQTVKVSDE